MEVWEIEKDTSTRRGLSICRKTINNVDGRKSISNGESNVLLNLKGVRPYAMETNQSPHLSARASRNSLRSYVIPRFR